MDFPGTSPVNPEIPQRWLFHSFRYASGRCSGLLESLGGLTTVLLSDRVRSELAQHTPWFVGSTLRGLIRIVCRGVESDPRIICTFANELTTAGVTHLVETIEQLTPFAEAARALVPHRIRSVVQFQGYETDAPYAKKIGLEKQMYRRIREAVESSGVPPVSVSASYNHRVQREIGIPASTVCDVPPGIPIAPPMNRERARLLVQNQFTDYQPEVPLVWYLGRLDAEKGIDLLLYAARIVREQGVKSQLANCGPTAFGSRYRVACHQIAKTLQLADLASDYVSSELRTALFRSSRCLVYPSIHAEPFEMVPVEAMVQGAPVVVADTGGVAQLPFLDQMQAGLTFRTWDSGDLAKQLRILLTDAELHAGQRRCTVVRGGLFCQAVHGSDVGTVRSAENPCWRERPERTALDRIEARRVMCLGEELRAVRSTFGGSIRRSAVQRSGPAMATGPTRGLLRTASSSLRTF